MTRMTSGSTTGSDALELRPMDTAARMDRLRQAMAASVDAVLVTAASNIRYLTGFTGSAGMLLVSSEDAVLVTDGRYRTQSAEQMEAAGVAARTFIGAPAEPRAQLSESVRRLRSTRVGLEADSITWAAQRQLAEGLTPADMVPTSGLVEGLRRMKDDGEQDRIEAAALIADRALAEVLDLLRDGRTEAEVALALDSAMRRLGAQAPAFETIVAGGPNAAKPHARPSARPVGRGEMVVVDFGATVDGYRSDMTRTFCVGEPDANAARVYEVVRASQAAGVDAVAAGRPAAEVDAACRDLIGEAGWREAFVHGTGHGVGLDIHEAPAVSATSTDTLSATSVVTVEPGIYLPGETGVRIEDTVVVTTEGCRTLTRFSKEPILG
jgi:Xaa-Pro aminopeptidase